MTSFLDRLKENKDKTGPDLTKERAVVPETLAKVLDTSPGLEKVAGFDFVPNAPGAVAEDLGGVAAIPKIEPDEAKAEKALLVAEATRVGQIAMRNGSLFKSDRGFFYASTDEQAEMLQDYAARRHVVILEKKEQK